MRVRRLRNWSLRAKLLAILLLLLVAGLVMQAIGSYTALRNHLMDDVDNQIGAFGQTAENYATSIAPPGQTPSFSEPNPDDDSFDDSLASSGILAAFVQIRSVHGTVTEEFAPNTTFGTPYVPAELALGSERVRYFNVEGKEPKGREGDRVEWRVRASRLDGNRGYIVLAQPLEEVDDTLREVKEYTVIGGTTVLLVVSLTGWWLIRRGLRSLDAMGVTARAIGGGDLSRRVEPANDRTEVGRLGAALNAMLGQLETAFEQRAESERKLRRFLADASHELRTPLTSIRGYAEMFTRGAHADPADAATSIRRIEEESARMTSLVDELLLLARLDEGRELERRPVDMSAVVWDAVADARAADVGRPIEFRPQPPSMVLGDELRLRQAVANLLANARVHTPAGVPVRVTESIESERNVMRVEVADDGPGLAPAQAKRVFERFYRADASRARTSGGSGLGLSIVKSIVEAHDGSVGVISEAGNGATFWFELPLPGEES